MKPAYICYKPNYLGWVSWVILALYVYLNTSLSYELEGPSKDNLTQQLAIFAIFCIVWFGWVGLRLSNAIFAAVALGPAALFHGYGNLLISFASLNPADLMMCLAIGIWIIQKPRLIWSKFSRKVLALFFVCVLSAMLNIKSSYFGVVLRLGLSVLLIWIIFSDKNLSLKRAFVDGLLLMPITVFAHLSGVNGLWRFLSFSEGRVLNYFNVGEVLYGSHLVGMYIIFIIPLVISKGQRKLVLPLMFAIAPYIMFSMSRSLILAIIATFFTYIMVNIRDLRSKYTVIWGILFIALIAVGISSIGFFTFSADGPKGSSNAVRVAKIKLAMNTYIDSPLLGVGYGTAQVVDSMGPAIVESLNDNFQMSGEIKSSSEFTPLQIMAETGTLGALISAWLIIFCGQRLLMCLYSSIVPGYVKVALYCWITLFLTGFIGSNCYNIFIYYLSFPVAAYEAYSQHS